MVGGDAPTVRLFAQHQTRAQRGVGMGITRQGERKINHALGQHTVRCQQAQFDTMRCHVPCMDESVVRSEIRLDGCTPHRVARATAEEQAIIGVGSGDGKRVPLCTPLVPVGHHLFERGACRREVVTHTDTSLSLDASHAHELAPLLQLAGAGCLGDGGGLYVHLQSLV